MTESTRLQGSDTELLAEARRLMRELESASDAEAFARADGDCPESEALKAMKVTDAARNALDAFLVRADRSAREDTDLLREVAVSGVESNDFRNYVLVQIDRTTWEALARFRDAARSSTTGAA